MHFFRMKMQIDRILRIMYPKRGIKIPLEWYGGVVVYAVILPKEIE